MTTENRLASRAGGTFFMLDQLQRDSQQENHLVSLHFNLPVNQLDNQLENHLVCLQVNLPASHLASRPPNLLDNPRDNLAQS